MKRRLRLRISQIRRQTIVPAPDTLRLLCPVCEREVEMLSSNQALRFLGVDPQKLGQFVAAGQIHSVRTVNGNTWVCKDSLFS